MPEQGLQARLRARALEAHARRRQAALRARASSRRRTSRIRRWPSTSTPASSARAACAPAARSRSTTSSAMRTAAGIRRSCSTSTIRWASRPASPAANACRRAPPARSRPAHDAYLVAGRQEGGVGVPVLRRRLPAHLPRPRQRDRARRGPRRPRQSRAAVRQGPLRLRLRRAPAAPDQAADPPRRRAEVRRLHRWIRPIRCRCSARRRGTKRWRSPAARCARSATRAGRSALAGFGSAKGSNEEAYLFQKLVRTGFGSNNVDHCTRLCHASSVAALLEGIGSGAVSNPVMDVMQADVVLLIGANPIVNHPVAATWIKNAVKNGTKLILADPRRSELARHADALPAVQGRHRRRAAERDDAHDRRGRPRRRVVRRRSHQRLRGAQAQRRRVQPGGDGADLRHSGARRSATVARLFATSQGRR